jgi:hypothetical protein
LTTSDESACPAAETTTAHTMVINPTYLAQRTRQCESYPTHRFTNWCADGGVCSCELDGCAEAGCEELSGVDSCCMSTLLVLPLDRLCEYSGLSRLGGLELEGGERGELEALIADGE